MKLETKRLIIRTPKTSDWKELVKEIGDKRITKFLSNVPNPYKKKDAFWWINKSKKSSRKKKPSDYGFVIILKSENKLIGGSGLHQIDHFTKKATTGSWIARDYWKKGYVTEAKIAINDFAFNKLKFVRLGTEAFTNNIASNTMIKKMGYKYEGNQRKAHRSKATKKWHDVNLYGMLKEDWEKIKPLLLRKLKKK
ncbi:GNAT family N-acetyltransferase [Nanoarchaeota archaeon]